MTGLGCSDDEIREIETLLRGGHKDVEGRCSPFADWRTKRRLIQGE